MFALFLIKSPNEVWRLIFLHRFLLLLSPQTKFGDLLFLHRFLLLLSYYYYYEHMSKSLTSLISETAKGISTRLGIYIK